MNLEWLAGVFALMMTAEFLAGAYFGVRACSPRDGFAAAAFTMWSFAAISLVLCGYFAIAY